MAILKGFIAIFYLLLAPACIAKNLGVYGDIYPIAEEDIRVFIYQKLQQININQANKQFIENIKKRILRPNPVLGLTTTLSPHIFYYDPTFILQKDITDADGKILISKGQKINPLSQVKLSKVLFFLNADDAREIAWARAQSKKYDFVKYVLTNGDIKDSSNALNSRVYFDQYGIITGKLGIKHIPCIVKQKGNVLEIREFSVAGKTNASN